jgi:hypothetical protein
MQQNPFNIIILAIFLACSSPFVAVTLQVVRKKIDICITLALPVHANGHQPKVCGL